MTMFYVDELVYVKKNGRKKYCHMIAETVIELHRVAAEIGVGRHFFHSSARIPHYDLSEEWRTKALQHGAIEISSRELVQIATQLNLKRLT